MSWSQQDLSFKKLSNKRVTTSTGKGLPEEKGASTLELYLPDIKTELIPGTGNTAYGLTGNLFYYGPTASFGQTLVVDTSVPNNLTWFATSGYGNTTTANDGSALSESRRLFDWVSDKFDAFGTVSGAGYEIKLYDGSNNLITKSDASNWLFDYQTGILMFNNTQLSSGSAVSTSGPYKIVGWRYVGQKGTIPAYYGGSGYTTYTKGDLLVGAGGTFIKLNVGSDNYVLTADSTTDSGLKWVVNSGSGSGISVLNGLSPTTQDFAVGTSGSLFNIVSSGSTHTFNIPIAGSGSTGLVSTGSQTFAGQKTFTSAIIGDLTGTATTAGYATTSNYSNRSGLATTAGFATTSYNINIVSANTGTFYPLFTSNSSTSSGAAVSIDGSDISYNFATNTFTAGTFSGNLSATAATATNFYGTLTGNVTGTSTTSQNINIVSATTGTFYPLFTNISSSASGVAVSVDSGISFDSATDTLTAGKFSGLASGSAATFTNFYGTLTGLATTATTAQNILNSTTSQNTDITVALISGTAISYNSSLVYNPSTGRLAATTYTGTWSGSTITAFYGGTGNTIYSKGDLLVGIGGTLIRLAVGTDNYVLTASSGSATGLTWSPTAASGITNLNTLTATTQFFSTGTSGSLFNISSSGSTHTFNIPIAGTGATGLVSTQAQSFAGTKTFTGDVIITSSTASTYMANGALTVNGGVGISGQLSVNQVAFGYTGIATNPVMAFIGSTNSSPITMSVLSDGSLLWEGSSGKLFGINNNLSSGWIFNVGDISGLPIIRANADGTIAMAEFAANVGVGLSNPSYKLHVAGDTNLSSGYVYRINGTSVLSSTQVLGLTVTSGNITSGAWSGTAISVLYGGTGLTSYTVGDILYASGSATIGRLTAGSAGSILVSAGAGATPYYSSPALFTSGNATTAANINIVSATTGTFYPLFTNLSSTSSGVAVSVDSGISFDSATDTLTAGKFSGLHSGTAATFTNIYGTLTGFATTATNVNSVSTTGTNASHFLMFSPVNGGSGVALSSGIGLTFNPSSGQLGLGTGSALINGLLLGTSANTITTASGNLTLNSAGGTVLVAGNFNVQGTATYIDSTTQTITDPVIVVGSGAGGTHTNVVDTQDRGIEYRRFSGSAITGFFGYSNSSGRFTFIPNANVTAANTYTGSVGVIEANITGTAITATNLYGALIGNAASATTAGLATTAQNLNISTTTTGTLYPLFTSVSTSASGVAVSIDGTDISYDAATNTLTAGKFSGLHSGTAATFTNIYGSLTGSATTATNVNVVLAGTNASHQVLFTPTSGTASGVAVSSENSFVYNPSTDILSVSGLAVTSSTASTSSTTGALIVTGGVGIGSSLNVGGRVGIGTNLLNAALNVQTPSSAIAGLIIRGSTSQSESLVKINSSIGGSFFEITNTGIVNIKTSTAGDFNSVPLQRWYDENNSITGVFQKGGFFYTGYGLGYVDSVGAQTLVHQWVPAGSYYITNWSQRMANGNSVMFASSAGGDVRIAGDSNGSLTFTSFGSYTGNTMVKLKDPNYGTNQALLGIVTPDGSYTRSQLYSYGNLALNMSVAGSAGTDWDTTNVFSANVVTKTKYTGNLAVLSVDSTNRFVVGPYGNTTVSLGGTTFSTGLLVKAAASQSGNLIETQASTGVTNFYVSPTGGASFSDNVEIKSAKEVRFNNTGNTFYTGFKAGANASNTTYTLPIAFPGSGTSILQSDTSGTLTWTGITGWATTATNLNVVAALSNTSHPLLFTPTSGSASGLAVSSNATLVYNPSSSILSVSGLAVTATTTSTSSSTGALTITGGVGIGGSLFTGTSTPDSISGVVLNNGVVTSGSWAGSTITARYGGTGYTSYALGDILVGAGNTFVKLSAGTNGYVLGANSNLPSGLGWTTVSGVAISTSTPASPKNADLWFNSEDGSLSVYYQDIDTSQWVEIAVGSGIDLTQQVHITSTIGSTSTTTGALIVDGGVGILGELHTSSLVINGTYDVVGTSITLSTTAANQAIYSLDASIYRSVKFMVQVTRGTDYQVQEILLLQDGIDTFLTQYAQLLSSNNLVLTTYDADLNSGNIRLLVSPTYANTTYKIYGTAVRL